MTMCFSWLSTSLERARFFILKIKI
jgi:hypothetical protein